MFPTPRLGLIMKTGAFNYYIPDNGERIQEGVMEGNIDINVVSVTQVEPYRAAQSLSHPAFLRLFFVDQENKNLVFERWTSTLEDWLEKRPIYRTYRPQGFQQPRWSVTQRIRDCIRYILHGLMHLHRKCLCFDMDFTKENIVLIGDMPKFFAVEVRSASEASMHKDYQNLRKLVKHTVLKGARRNCPGDMLNLMDLLAHPSKNKELLENHCSMWTDMEQMDFFQRFIDGGKLVKDSKMKPVFTKLNTFPEIWNWKLDATRRKRSLVYDVYYKQPRFCRARGHYIFLRAYKSHVGDYSKKGLLYNMDMVQDAIAATFPCSLCYLQAALHENNMLMDFIPRKRETAFE